MIEEIKILEQIYRYSFQDSKNQSNRKLQISLWVGGIPPMGAGANCPWGKFGPELLMSKLGP